MDFLSFANSTLGGSLDGQTPPNPYKQLPFLVFRDRFGENLSHPTSTSLLVDDVVFNRAQVQAMRPLRSLRWRELTIAPSLHAHCAGTCTFRILSLRLCRPKMTQLAMLMRKRTNFPVSTVLIAVLFRRHDGAASTGPFLGLTDERPRKRGKYNKRSDKDYTARLAAAVNVCLNNLAVDPKKPDYANVALLYDLKDATLRRHVDAAQNGVEVKNPGRQTHLTSADEAALIEWLKVVAVLGWPATKRTIMSKARQIAEKRHKPFTKGSPSRRWYRSFKSRHPDVCKRRPRTLTRDHANIRPEILIEFVDLLEKTIKDNNIDISMIANMDETGAIDLFRIVIQFCAIRSLQTWRNQGRSARS